MDGMVLANIYITLDSAISKTFNMFLNNLQMMLLSNIKLKECIYQSQW